MAIKNYDFGGWATKYDRLCGDGRTICKNAFKECDGMVVPLVWNHLHNKTSNILGHALLEHRPDVGIYAYCSFNNTDSAKEAKEQVRHDDIKSLSIFANKLIQDRNKNVSHGIIREVSLVLAGANPGATIDEILYHGEFDEDEAIIWNDETEPLVHSEDDSYKPNNSEEKKETEGKKEMDENKTLQEIYDTLNDEQKMLVDALVGIAVEDTKDELKKNNTEEEKKMKHNAFDNGEGYEIGGALTHSDIEAIFSDAKRNGSLKESFLQHAEEYGIKDIEWLFPEDKLDGPTPKFINKPKPWVAKVMNSVHHSPVSRVKSLFADISEDDARALGYIKGNRKKTEVFTLLKRSTSPQTIYKKQKLDRNDIIDITDFDVTSWIKGEMRLKLDEELARAILIGDGRDADSDDKISEEHIRPIWKDDDLYVIRKVVPVANNATDDDRAKAFIKAAIKARQDYQGSGNPICFTSEDMITDILLLEDGFGHALYADESAIAKKLRVKEIVGVPHFRNAQREVGDTTRALAGIIVNLDDYTIGADKGGSINMFEDFDIDFNQQKYLIETRCSGGMTTPFGAMVIEFVPSTALKVNLTPISGSTTKYGKLVSTLQSDVFVGEDIVTGELKYVDGGWTPGTWGPGEDKGNYIALAVTGTSGATITVELLGGHSGPITIDDDNEIVFRIEDKRKQSIKITAELNGSIVSKTFRLSALSVDKN